MMSVTRWTESKDIMLLYDMQLLYVNSHQHQHVSVLRSPLPVCCFCVFVSVPGWQAGGGAMITDGEHLCCTYISWTSPGDLSP